MSWIQKESYPLTPNKVTINKNENIKKTILTLESLEFIHIIPGSI